MAKEFPPYKNLIYKVIEMNKNYLNIKQAAEELGINVKLMTKLTHQKDFPCIRFERRVVINKNLLEEWFRNNSNKFIK